MNYSKDTLLLLVSAIEKLNNNLLTLTEMVRILEKRIQIIEDKDIRCGGF